MLSESGRYQVDDILGPFGSAFAKQVAKELARELRAANDSDWVSQHDSPLGNRRHCAAVRRRVGRGCTDAVIDIGRKRFLMSREALKDEMLALNSARVPVKADPVSVNASECDTGVSTVRDRLLRKLGR